MGTYPIWKSKTDHVFPANRHAGGASNPDDQITGDHEFLTELPQSVQVLKIRHTHGLTA